PPTRTSGWLAADSDLARLRCFDHQFIGGRFPAGWETMIQLLPQLKIFLAYQPVDFRKGIDGLVSLCRSELQADPYDGSAFVFRNRRGTALKILTFDGMGQWLSRRFHNASL